MSRKNLHENISEISYILNKNTISVHISILWLKLCINYYFVIFVFEDLIVLLPNLEVENISERKK